MGSLLIENGYFNAYLSYEVDTSYKKKVVLKLTELAVRSHGEKRQLGFNVYVDGKGIYSKSGSYPADERASVNPKVSYDIDRADSSQRIVLRFHASREIYEYNREATLTIASFADDVIRPAWKVTGLAVKRDGGAFTASWKVPSAATKDSNPNRITGVYAKFRLTYDDGSKSDKTMEVYNSLDPSTTSYTKTWGAFGGRKAFFPATAKKVESITAIVRGYHRRGWSGGHTESGRRNEVPGDAAQITYSFKLPSKPTLRWDYDPSTSKATLTVESDGGEGMMEWHSTRYAVSVVDRLGNPVSKGAKVISATSWQSTFDLTQYLNNMGYGDSVSIKATAISRGARGAAEEVSSTRTIARPTRGAITAIKKNGTDIKVGFTRSKWASSIQLQRRHGANGSAENVDGAIDNSSAGLTAFHDTVSAAQPVPGERIYYRLESKRDNWTVQSAWVAADCLYTAVPEVVCSAKAGIVGITPGKAGTSATVIMGFTDATANTGCELSYSTDRLAWSSSNGPATVQYTGSDASRKTTAYAKTRTVALEGLTLNRTYWFRVRRYLAKDGTTRYSAYSDAFALVAKSAANDKCDIKSAVPDSAGTGATVIAAFTEDDANTGTEFSWSERKGAWANESDGPETLAIAGKDATPAYKGCTGTKTAKIDGLAQGTTYYVRARRYLDYGGQRSYSPYSAIWAMHTESAADDACGIISMEPDADGKGCHLAIGYTEDNRNTGTEVQWSDYRHAWRSNAAPSAMQADWQGAAYSGERWDRYQDIYLRDLEPGAQYYIRARRYLTAGGTTTYSPFSALRSFSTPLATATNDRCAIISAQADGTGGARVVIGYSEDTGNTGTEVTWSDDPDAWESSKAPSSLEADWADASPQASGWGGTQTVHLRGLDAGATYYIRARRYLEGGEGTTYSPYSQTLAVTLPARAQDPTVLCGIVSLEADDTGTGATLVVGWDGDRTGCEASWSTDPDAWESNAQPSTQEFAWADPWNKSGFKTADAAIDASKTYYTRTGEGTDESPYLYEAVASPKAADLPGYYELAWSATSTLHLRGLTEGATYYVKARSYCESGGTVWSDYTQAVAIVPISAPLSVLLSGPSAIGRGEPIDLYWTLESELGQAEWYVYAKDADNALLASGEGSLCHASLDAGKYGSAESIALCVKAGCGGALTESNPILVAIADAPSCEIAVCDTLKAQPLEVELYCDDEAARALLTVSSLGVSAAYPDGERAQLGGDAVYTGSIHPDWVATPWQDTLLYAQLTASKEELDAEAAQAYSQVSFIPSTDTSVDGGRAYYIAYGDTYTQVIPDGTEDPSSEGWYVAGDADAESAWLNAQASLRSVQGRLSVHRPYETVGMCKATLPIMDLIDGGSYRVSASTVEPIAQLSSQESEGAFTVAWEHQAPAPSDAIATNVDETGRSATIALAQPEGWAETDVYDIYRRTQTGYDLIASGLAPDAAVTDRFAPYGSTELSYRVAVRTADGDVDFADYTYEMPLSFIRFDWPGGYVELPWNIELSQSWAKAFESREHADGSVNGYYDRAVTMSATYSTDVVKIRSAETLEAVRGLAEYPGAVFCRDQHGAAFMCDAQVSGLNLAYSSASADVSFSVTGLKLADMYRPGIEDIGGGE